MEINKWIMEIPELNFESELTRSPFIVRNSSKQRPEGSGVGEPDTSGRVGVELPFNHRNLQLLKDPNTQSLKQIIIRIGNSNGNNHFRSYYAYFLTGAKLTEGNHSRNSISATINYSEFEVIRGLKTFILSLIGMK